jgi:hypothetical protein
MTRSALLFTTLLATAAIAGPVPAAEPVRIGITTILSSSTPIAANPSSTGHRSR